MKTIKTWLNNPLQRRQLLTAASGLLILVGLAADYLDGGSALYTGSMVAAALLAGSDIALRAWSALRHRHISIELLVTVATVGALLIGEVWEAAAVTFLFMLGAYLEARTLNRTRQTLQQLFDLAPTTAIALRSGQQVEVLAHEVQPGETVLIKPGTKIPVDGEVLDGRAAVDESPITGESIPVEKTKGATVYAGTVSQNGLLQVRVSGAGADTTLARIIHRVEEAQEEKAPTQRFIERFARWYTPAIIGLSFVTFLLSRDIELALTLLVIGCPGALVISTPVSVVAGIGRAAKRGILIKGGEYLENAGKITALALDKTGTLTQGQPRLTDVIALQPVLVPAGNLIEVGDRMAGRFTAPATNGKGRGRWDETQQEVLRWAAIAEAGSEHPLARPILAEAATLGLIPSAGTFETCTGRGVRATYQGHTIGVGTAELMNQLGVMVQPEAEAVLAQLKSAGKTAVLVALDGLIIGILGIADPLRPAAPAMLRQLNAVGLKRIVMLTGDDRRTAQAIAAEAGLTEVYAELLPEDKLAVIRRLQAEGHVVAMAGDGINDAPALAAADIGLAMGAAGTDVALETADIALMADDLLKIPEAIGLSKATLRNIRQNVVIALVTVAGLLAGVLLGEVHMAEGMFIHELSVLVVILNGMRLLRA
ncbi:MAG: heavy metal translocating P-type ATPase [Anaerolineae bacterium]|nr:cation-translocating P-type ATPase [Anaerolineae bacterium]MCQ3972996.1 heavy metal translocating P-type ATPase [Anaerolineae bacterium]